MATVSTNRPEVEYEIIVKERRKVRETRREWQSTGSNEPPMMDYTPPLDVESIVERDVFTIKTASDPRGGLLRMLVDEMDAELMKKVVTGG